MTLRRALSSSALRIVPASEHQIACVAAPMTFRVHKQVVALKRMPAHAVRRCLALLNMRVAMTPLCHAIADVLKVRPAEQVVRVDADAVVATVADFRALWDRAVKKGKHAAVGVPLLQFDINLPVSVVVFRAVPLPTAVAAAFANCVNAAQELVDFHARNITQFAL